MIPIVPAFIPTSEDEVRSYAQSLAFSDEIHLDVVDGVFTPTASWPYQPAGNPNTVKPYTDQFTLEVDLMVQEPLQAAFDWVTAGADMLVFHAETINLENFKHFEEFTHVTVGISAHGETATETLLEYAQYADCVQVMGIKDIGAQGQPFYEPVLETIATLKQTYPDKPVTVDGSVNKSTIAKLAAAGADRFVVGSAIVKQPDPHKAYTELQHIINQS